MLLRLFRFNQNRGHFISWGYGSLLVLAVFRKLFKNFLSQTEPIWILNTCYDFSISSVYFLISSQIRLKSFHLKWHGYALKWMERNRFDKYVCMCVCVAFCHQSDHTFLINWKTLILKTMKKTKQNKIVCDWQLVSLGGGFCDLELCTDMSSTRGLS